MLTPAQTRRWSYLAEKPASAAEEPAAKRRRRQGCCLPGSGERLFAERRREPDGGQAPLHARFAAATGRVRYAVRGAQPARTQRSDKQLGNR